MADRCLMPHQLDKMGFHMGRQLLLSGFLLVMLQVVTQTQARPQVTSEDYQFKSECFIPPTGCDHSGRRGDRGGGQAGGRWR